MTDGVRRLREESADQEDELRVRLQMIDDAHLRLPVRVDVHAVDAAGNPTVGDDIMAVAFIVMMEASKSAQDDLKAIMAGVKAINDTKQALRRDLVSAATTRARPTPCPPDCGADLDAVLSVLLTAYGLDVVREANGLIDGLDPSGELGPMESLRLQMGIERRSRFLSMLSNVMKKVADTESAIVQNMK